MSVLRWKTTYLLLLSITLLVSSPEIGLADEPLADSPVAEAPPVETALTETPLSESDRDHWAFQPIARPLLPAVQESDWLRTGVDAFILAKLEKKTLSPAPDAGRATLLRRLSFDLTGLPPTPAEVAAFENDPAPDAYERQVDRLLASPAYGERWGQHWLDLARFAETDGFEHDKLRADAWRYRDWVIAALNADLPYDRFVALQLAGDEIGGQESGGRGQESGDREQESGDREQESEKATSKNAVQQSAIQNPQSAIPTTFCLAGPDMIDINDQVERRHNLLNELTSTVGSVLLGLQLGCAQCHDHKYDPLSQADFYRLRAVFEPAVPALKNNVPYNTLRQQPKTSPARLWIRGDHRRPGPELPPGFPRIATHGSAAVDTTNSDNSRVEFARWLMQDENPLTARVMANRLWQHHFGRGIFDTPSDVGVINAGPTHPELLDWLASELRDRAWGLKQLQRTLVCSATYRQTSRAAQDQDAAWQQRLQMDPANELYSRFPRRRLDGETLRDAMLAAAGLLSNERGGRGVMPPLPEELIGALLKGQWSTSEREADHYRRSIYLFARRNLRYPIFDAFDRPDGNASCAVRSRSTTAPQSLVLFNSEFSLLVARQLAGQLAQQSSEPRHQLEQLYLRAYSRRPTQAESVLLTQFLAQQQAQLAAESRPRDELSLPSGWPATADPYAGSALVDACLSVLNTSEFLYPD